jgi:hypothetical protein
MDVFIQYLNTSERKFVKSTLSRLKKNYTRMDEFYTDAYTYFNEKFDVEKYYPLKLQLQALLTNENYPWYAMVNVLQTTKYCMEMYIV